VAYEEQKLTSHSSGGCKSKSKAQQICFLMMKAFFLVQRWCLLVCGGRGKWAHWVPLIRTPPSWQYFQRPPPTALWARISTFEFQEGSHKHSDYKDHRQPFKSICQNKSCWAGVVVHICNTSYTGGRGRTFIVQGCPEPKEWDPIWKITKSKKWYSPCLTSMRLWVQTPVPLPPQKKW
jgi:hypothetical protein